MPTWLRKYYIKKINTAVKKQNAEIKKAQGKTSSRKSPFTGFPKK